MPDKPKTAFMLFYEKKLKENNGKKYTLKILGEMHINLPETEYKKRRMNCTTE